MKLLLDTHTFLWWVEDAPQLSAPARKRIEDGENECFLSMASCWEMGIKSSIGKLKLAIPIADYIPQHLSANGFRLLDISFRHVAKVENLPSHHRDPFDRLLISQAITDKLDVVSADSTFNLYGINRIW